MPDSNPTRELTAGEYGRLYNVALDSARVALSRPEYDAERDYFGDELRDDVFSATLDYADSTDDLSWVDAVTISDIAGEAIDAAGAPRRA